MGSFRSMSWSMRLKMAVLAPMPSASERIATEAKSGLRRIARSENRMSGHKLVMLGNTPGRGFGYIPGALDEGTPRAVGRLVTYFTATVTCCAELSLLPIFMTTGC